MKPPIGTPNQAVPLNRIYTSHEIEVRYRLWTPPSKIVTLAGMGFGYGQFRDSGNSMQSREHRTRPRKVRVRRALTKLMLVFALLFGKRRPTITAADVFRWPIPCVIRQVQRSVPAGAVEARYGSEALKTGRTEHGPGVEAHAAGPGATLGDRLVKPRGAFQARRRRVRRRLRYALRRVRRRLRNPLRPGPRSPRRSPRRIRRRPGQRPAEPGS